MKRVRLLASIVLALAIAQPAAANSLNPWGMWGDGAKLKKGKFKFGLKPPSQLGAQNLKNPVAVAKGGGRPNIAPKSPKTIAFNGGYAVGTVIIDTKRRKLFYTLPGSQAYVYPIAVGKRGFTWTGMEMVSKIVDWPDWVPPKEMRQRQASLPLRMTGGLRNPLGAKAIYLGKTLYRIHGTNNAKSIGTASSSGCIRMHNSHVVHLASMITSGSTVVHVVKSVPAKALNVKAKTKSAPKTGKGQAI